MTRSDLDARRAEVALGQGSAAAHPAVKKDLLVSGWSLTVLKSAGLPL